MKLTKDNYFSKEADEFYMSVSQYNSFNGIPAIKTCEARAFVKLEREWKEDKTVPQLVGSYVDAYFDESLDEFKAEKVFIMFFLS